MTTAARIVTRAVEPWRAPDL